jgi:hypothetical protein
MTLFVYALCVGFYSGKLTGRGVANRLTIKKESAMTLAWLQKISTVFIQSSALINY